MHVSLAAVMIAYDAVNGVNSYPETLPFETAVKKLVADGHRGLLIAANAPEVIAEYKGKDRSAAVAKLVEMNPKLLGNQTFERVRVVR